jgi:hypothetical protein
LYLQLSAPLHRIATLFETIAFLSTLAFVGVFVFLFQMDRAGRKEE